MNYNTIKQKLESYYETMTPESVLQEFEDMDVEFKGNMFKKSQQVILNVRGVHKTGIVQSKKRREDVVYYDIVVDSFKLYEGITIDKSMPVYINEELSIKLNNQILNPIK